MGFASFPCGKETGVQRVPGLVCRHLARCCITERHRSRSDQQAHLAPDLGFRHGCHSRSVRGRRWRGKRTGAAASGSLGRVKCWKQSAALKGVGAKPEGAPSVLGGRPPGKHARGANTASERRATRSRAAFLRSTF